MNTLFHRRMVEPFYVGADGTEWAKKISDSWDPASDHMRFTETPGVTDCAKNAMTIKECWQLFFPQTMMERIVLCTNVNIEESRAIQRGNPDTSFVDLVDVHAFFGILYTVGSLRSNYRKVANLWAIEGFGVDILPCVMPKNRFVFLMKYIRFDDVRDYDERIQLDKMTAVREVFEIFVKNCRSCYTVCEYTAIDELVLCFKNSFQYKQNKPNKYVHKLFAHVDGKKCYVSNMVMYVSSQPEGPYAMDNSMSSLVKSLVANINNTGRNVTVDNGNITSLTLADDLLRDRISIVGTINKELSQIPTQFVTMNRKALTSIVGYTDDKTLLSYKPADGEIILLLSTMNKNRRIDPRSGGVPEIVQFYNMTKDTVNVVDFLAHQHTTVRENATWPQYIFSTMLNIGGVNSHIIYQENTGNKYSRYMYLNALGRELINDQLRRRILMKNLPRVIELRLGNYCGVIDDPVIKIRKEKKSQVSPQEANTKPDTTDRKDSLGKNISQARQNTSESEGASCENRKK